jgi:hypothetical protein
MNKINALLICPLAVVAFSRGSVLLGRGEMGEEAIRYVVDLIRTDCSNPSAIEAAASR